MTVARRDFLRMSTGTGTGSALASLIGAGPCTRRRAMNTTFDELRARHPDWSGWRDVVARTLEECADAGKRYAPLGATRSEDGPSIVARLTPSIDGLALQGWLQRVWRCAGASDLPDMKSLACSTFSSGEARELFEAELDADFERLAAFAARTRIGVEALRAVANLFVMPVMHACRETEAATEALRSWCEGYCGCCGAWPAYAEICGIARERRLCCGRCGTNWAHDVLACVYCGTSDHKLLSMLDVESDGLHCGIEVCERCRGYLKQFRRLTPSGPIDVLVRDLGSVALDLAATERSYVRPRGVGRAGTVLP